MQPALLKEADRLGVGDLLLLEHPVRQRLRRVVFGYYAWALQDDRSGVVGVVDKMDGAAADLAAVLDDRAMNLGPEHPLATEAREQRRVDVHRPAQVALRHVEQAQPTGKANQVDAGVVAEGED